MSLGELLLDMLRSPLAQAAGLAAALGIFLLAFGPSFGWKDTFRGAALGFGRAPAFELNDQHGRPVALEDLSGGPVVLTFIYTRCATACPLTTANVGRTLELLGKDAATVRPLAITVDPERDGPAELRAYAERYRLGPGWRLLGGPSDAVSRVVTAYHAQPIAAAAERDAAHANHATAQPADEILHPTVVMLIDAHGALRFAYGPGFDPQDLAHDIRLMQRDMGGPTVPFPLY
jgi:cytochrome oxidase Cu insertion factor (SCO1/SenC/PrrC family)